LDSLSTNWVLYSQGLPNVITTDIEFNQTTNKIYISTFGRGIWETDLTALTGVNSNLNLSNEIKIYPTINNGNFKVDLSNIKYQKVTMKIIDVLGKVIETKEVDASVINTINVNLPKGMYYISLDGNQYLGSGSIVIQ
jgi:xyloglucan-specific exo-beta-1,4-glucanase